MKRTNPENLSVSELVATYKEATLLYGSANGEGDSEQINKQHDIIMSIQRELTRRSSGWKESFLELLDDDSPWVRLVAAGFALRFAPHKAEPVLQDMASGPDSLYRLDAEMTLQEWRRGNVKA